MSSDDTETATNHRAKQQDYFDGDPDRASIRPVDSPYVRRHLAKGLAAAGLRAGDGVLEVGAGSGRFTRLMVEAGLKVHASELSPVLAEAIGMDLEGRLTGVSVCGIEDLADHLEEPATAAVGFFMLHHLYDLDDAFRGLARALAPGARVAFVEPNGWNPLFYLQVLLSPSMTWAVDGGIRHMRPGKVFGAMRGAGFVDLECERYGVFPPFLANTGPGRAIEAALERLPLPPPCWAFQVFSGRIPDARA
jgi:SAM-dependent methyltransferase